MRLSRARFLYFLAFLFIMGALVFIVFLLKTKNRWTECFCRRLRKVLRFKALINTKTPFYLHFSFWTCSAHFAQDNTAASQHAYIYDWRKKNVCFSFIFTVIRRKIRVFSLKSGHFKCKCRGNPCNMVNIRKPGESFDSNNNSSECFWTSRSTNKTENTNSLFVC